MRGCPLVGGSIIGGSTVAGNFRMVEIFVYFVLKSIYENFLAQ